MQSTTLNIGLTVNGGLAITPDHALAALRDTGAQLIRFAIRQSTSEPTLIAELAVPLSGATLYLLAAALDQECIAQLSADSIGILEGPGADKWRPFNIEYFLTFEE